MTKTRLTVKLRYLLPIILLFFHIRTIAQPLIPDLRPYKTINEKLHALALTCDSLNEANDWEGTREVARYALNRVPASDYVNLSLFLFHIGYTYEGINADSSILYFEKSLYWAQKAGNRKRIVNAYKRLAWTYNNTPGYAVKRDATAAALVYIADSTKNNTLKADMYSLLANYHSVLGSHEKEVTYLLYTLNIAKQNLTQQGSNATDSANLGVAYMNIGEAYLVMEQPDKAIEYTLAAKIYLRSYPAGITHYYKDLADAYMLKDDMATAKRYYDSLTQILESRTDAAYEWSFRTALDLSFVEHYLGKNNQDQASLYIKRAQEVSQKYPDPLMNAQVNYMAGRHLVMSQKYNQALPLLHKAMAIGPEIGMEVYTSLLGSLAECYNGLGQYKEAAKYYRQYAPLRDSLYKISSTQSIASAEAKYQNKEKQQQIENKNLQLAIAGKQQIALLSGMALLVLVALLLMIIYRNKRKTAQKLQLLNQELKEANATKSKLFSIIGHDLRSPISQVYQFLKLQQHHPELIGEKEKAALSHKIQNAAGSLLESMEDLLLWSKTQLTSFNASLEPTLLLPIMTQCEGLLQLNSEAKTLALNNTIPPSLEVSTDPYFLQIILRNLLQNAIKASPQKGTIHIRFSEQQQTLAIVNEGAVFQQVDYENAVNDNQSSKGLSGLGLKLVDELSKKINLSIRFEALPEGQTQVLIVFA